MDGSVFHFGDNSQPDDFLCLLQEFSEDQQCTKTQTTTPITQGVSGTDCSNRTNNRSPTSRMVGLSSAELESLNELIQIDHVYVKPQPLKSLIGKEAQHKSTTAVIKQDVSESAATQHSKQYIVLSGLKRNHEGATVNVKSPVVQLSPVPTLDLINPDNSDTPELPVLTSLQSQLELQDDSDDIISTLSDSDMETSLNYFQNFDLDMAEANRQVNTSSQNNNYSFLLSDSLKQTEELNSTKLFDEIYEHYLSIRESSVASPNSTAFSDSGISSDTEPLSPHSLDGEAFHDTLLWQDTSFTDLFPDLQ
ncbi:X-box-binding protein 1 [Biomphalaria glabrata]|nr:Biomphalaria glabrata X-box-binding protein 1-like [Biomphalaria glabrata]